MSHPSTTTPDLATMVARLFGIQDRHEVVRVPNWPGAIGVPAAAQRRVVTLPTQQDIDDPTTTEARAALAMTAQQLAGIVERKTGVPTTAASVYDDARAMLSTYLRTYRRVAERER